MSELARIGAAPSKILVGSLAIDRDQEHVERVFSGIECLSRFCRWDLLVVTRETDEIAREKWGRKGAEVVAVPDYSIEKRHNLWRIADKRNLVCKRGREKDYDAVFFVDSDVIVAEGALEDLFRCSEYADVVVVPYKIPWTNEHTVAIVEDGRIKLVNARPLMEQTGFPRILGGGMGCTLIQRRALDVPFVPMKLGNVSGNIAGEDIGFFYKIHTERPDLVVRTTSWPFVAEHLF